MFDFPILEVAIGLSFVYLFLSLICSTLTELIARAFAMRSNSLKEAIENILKNDEIIDQFFRHPLVNRLSKDGIFDKLIGRKSFPSYISPNIFARVLLDVISLKNSGKNLEDVINAINDNEIKRLLQSITRDAGNNIGKVKKNIEDWFDESMDRVSGWYGRKAQLITVFLALGVTFLFNADTPMIAKGLSQDSILRESVVAAAGKYIRTSTSNGTEEQDAGAATDDNETDLTIMQLQHKLNEIEDLKQLNLPIGWSFTPYTYMITNRSIENIQKSGVSETVLTELKNIEDKGFVGKGEFLTVLKNKFDDKDFNDYKSLILKYAEKTNTDPRVFPIEFWGLITKLAGLLFTVIAVALGAPFWFGVLNKLVNIRSTGKEPETEKT